MSVAAPRPDDLARLAAMAQAARAQVGDLRGQLDELRRVIAELRGDEPQTGHAGAEPTRAPRHAQEEA